MAKRQYVLVQDRERATCLTIGPMSMDEVRTHAERVGGVDLDASAARPTDIARALARGNWRLFTEVLPQGE